MRHLISCFTCLRVRSLLTLLLCHAFYSLTHSIYLLFVLRSPEIDSRKARHGLLKVHTDVLGSASAFDGSILFLPKELKPVSWF